MKRFKPERNGLMLEEFAWKNGRESLGKYEVDESKRGLQRWRCPPGMEEGTRKQEIQKIRKWEKVAGRDFSLCCGEFNLQRLQCK